MKKLFVFLLAAVAITAGAQESSAPIDLRPTGDLKAVIAEEHRCLVAHVYEHSAANLTDEQAHANAVESCVQYGFGALRHSAYFVQRYGKTLLDPVSAEGVALRKSVKGNALFWLSRAIPRCSVTADSVEACFSIWNLT